MLKIFVFLCCLCTAATTFHTSPLYAESSFAESKVLAFAGSTRVDSINKKLVKEAARIAQEMGATVKLIDLKDYPAPFYEGDLEAAEGVPATTKQLRQLIDESQVILIASPEYNGSYSPLLKNTLDWLSRMQNSFKGKSVVIMSTSPGKLGGMRGLVLLKALLEELGATVLPQQVSLPHGNQAFNEAGHLIDPKWEKALMQAIQQIPIPLSTTKK